VIDYKVSSFCSLGNCVEVGVAPDGGIAVRDGKSPETLPLLFTTQEWRDFVAGVRAGEFDFG
jgi:hypothetical protein